MRNSDLVARIAAGLELLGVLMNLFFAFIWFITMIWVLVGVLWIGVGLLALVEGAIAVFVLVKGYSPVGIVGPLIGLFVSACNFNLLFGFGVEGVALVLMIGALIARQSEVDED